MTNNKISYHPAHFLVAWLVHLFTASGAFIGLLSLIKIQQHHYSAALWLMGATIIIDAVDGALARLVRVKSVLPTMDGTLLDNMVDYLNYVLVPCFFLVVCNGMLPDNLALYIIFAVIITSAYQFCQEDAKTPDHFFKGFPCYWNIVVFYMYIFNTSAMLNSILLTILCILIFIPIKYVYPSRLDYLTKSPQLKVIMHCCSILFGISSGLVLWNYPYMHPFWLTISFGYVVMYLFLSIYRTYSPMIMAKINSNR